MFDSDFSNIYLLFNISIWLITLIWYQRRRQYVDAGSIILGSFLLYAILSYITYNDPYAEYKPLKLYPFLYLYAMIMMFAAPALRYDQTKIDSIQQPSKQPLYIVLGIYIICSYLYIPGTLPNLFTGIQRIMLEPLAGSQIYDETMSSVSNSNMGHGNFRNLSGTIYGVFSDIGILFFFYYLTLKQKNKFILFSLFFAFITSPFVALAESQRGPAVNRFLTILITYFAFRKMISPKIDKVIKIVGLSLGIGVVVILSAITTSRFGHTQGGEMSSVYSYAGMENIMFNNYAFDNNGIRYGDRTFPFFKMMLGFDNVPHNFYERRDKYKHHKIDDGVFIGFVGDFVLDFGPIMAVVIFILFFVFSINRTIPIQGVMPFHHLLLLHFIMCVCIQGGMKLYSYADMGNFKVMGLILVYIYFKIDYDRQQKYQVIAQNTH